VGQVKKTNLKVDNRAPAVRLEAPNLVNLKFNVLYYDKKEDEFEWDKINLNMKLDKFDTAIKLEIKAINEFKYKYLKSKRIWVDGDEVDMLVPINIEQTPVKKENKK
jgi:hypothetical protein